MCPDYNIFAFVSFQYFFERFNSPILGNNVGFSSLPTKRIVLPYLSYCPVKVIEGSLR